MRTLARLGLSLLVVSSVATHFACTAGVKIEPPDQEKQSTPQLQITQVKPQWNVGDQWTIETETQQFQVRNDPKQKQQLAPVQWQFRVTKIEQIAGAPAYRIEVTSAEKKGRQQPATTLWIDQKQGTIRQIQTQIPVQGGFRTITESYVTQSGQPTPIIGPLSALPLDLPIFQQGTKSNGSFQYQSFAGPAGTKAVGEVSFTNSVEQQYQQTKPADAEKLLSPSFVKSLDKKPTVSVQLKGNFRQINQIWQKEIPWPIYSDNGSTKSKLIKFTPAKK